MSDPFTQPQEDRITQLVSQSIEGITGHWKKIAAIVTAIVTPVLAFLGYLGAGELRDAFNREQSRLVTEGIASRSEEIVGQLKADLDLFMAGQKQTQDIFAKQLADDRTQLRTELFHVIRDAAEKSAANRSQLEQFVAEQKQGIIAMKTAIEREVAEANAVRDGLRLAADAALRTEGELKVQLQSAIDASTNMTDLLSQMSFQCEALQKQGKELDEQIATLRPKMEVIRTILADQNAAEIFSKLQQDFTRIRSLEVRMTYSHPADSPDEPILPFDGIWIRREGEPFLQLYPDHQKTTIIRSGDSIDLVYRYVLFAPHEMRIEGQPLRDLEKVDQLEIYYSWDRARYEIPPSAVEYVDLVTRFQSSLGRLSGVRMQVLINGYSSFEKRFAKADLAIPQLPAGEFETAWERALVLPVAEMFADPEAHYSKQFAPPGMRTAGAAFNSPIPNHPQP